MRLIILTLAFVLSGAAGLVYESTWTRYLSLFVGHDAYAQAMVLVIFLGGMSAGAWLGGRWSTAARSPLLGFAAVEAAAGAIGLLFHSLYLGLTGWAHASVFPLLADGIWLGPAKWLIGAFLLLPQSLLLGASFPLMAAGVLRLAPDAPGRRLARLYFANSLGAAAGVLVGGFVLIPWGGLPGAIRVAAGANLLVAAIVALVAWRSKGVPAVAQEVPVATPPVPGGDRTRPLLLAVSAGTAVASFLYEIDWIRMLSLVLGSATHSFELMLSAFILGLALGALWISGRADTFRRPFTALGTIQILMGICALGTLIAYAHSFEWMAWLLRALTRTDAGYEGFTLARYGIAAAIMLPATCFAGMTLPLITRILFVRGGGATDIGAAYAWNTFGAIVGVVAGSLVLLPWLGVKGMMVLAGAIDILLGVSLVAADRGNRLGRPTPRTLYVGIGGVVLAALAITFAVRLDPLAMASGVYRTGALLDPGTKEIAFYRDGRTSTVSVVRSPGTGNFILTTNGKPDASVIETQWRTPCSLGTDRRTLDGDVSTQVLLPLITLAHRPEARRAAVVGFGSGMSTHMLLGSAGLDSVITLEIEPAMVEAARMLHPINARAFDDPRARVVYTDARSYLAASGRPYDLIMSEPSNPWVSGVAGLFTVEFYERVSAILAPGGVFGQWLHAYELDDELAVSVLSAIHEAFGDYAVYQVGRGDFLVVATADQQLPGPDWGVFDAPGLADLRCRTFMPTPATMRALRAGGRDLFTPLFIDGPAANSDFHPILDLGAERRRFLERRAAGLEALVGDWRGFAAALEGGEPLPPEAVPPPPFLTTVGVSSRAASTLADAAAHPRPADVSEEPDTRFAREQWNAWRHRLGGPAPTDWRSFLVAFDGLSMLAHRGTSGYAHAELFASAERFLVRHRAPEVIGQAVAFRKAVLEWRHDRVVAVGTALLPTIAAGTEIVGREAYVDAMLVAAIQTGRADVAARVLTSLGLSRPGTGRDLRNDLLSAHLMHTLPRNAPTGPAPRTD